MRLFSPGRSRPAALILLFVGLLMLPAQIAVAKGGGHGGGGHSHGSPVVKSIGSRHGGLSAKSGHDGGAPKSHVMSSRQKCATCPRDFHGRIQRSEAAKGE